MKRMQVGMPYSCQDARSSIGSIMATCADHVACAGFDEEWAYGASTASRSECVTCHECRASCSSALCVYGLHMKHIALQRTLLQDGRHLTPSLPATTWSRSCWLGSAEVWLDSYRLWLMGVFVWVPAYIIYVFYYTCSCPQT